MRKYETIAILKPDSPEDYVSTLSKKVEKAIATKPGELIKKDDWGVKRLAYEIAKQKQGRYLYWSYMQSPKSLGEIDKKLRFEENVLRFVTVVTEEKKAEPARPDRKSAKPAKPGKSDRSYEPKEEREYGFARQKVPGGAERLFNVDFKDTAALSKFITDRGKIVPRRVSGIDAVSQRAIAVAVKRARQVALLSYTEGFFVSSSSSSEERGE